MTMTATRNLWLHAALACAAALTLQSCDGSSKSTTPGVGAGGDARLTKVEYGRLVDIYAYRRASPTRGTDRRDRLNRVPTLIARNVVVSAAIETDPLFDVNGDERLDATYEFMPFDVNVGHEELLILWDDRQAGERERFQAAVERASAGLDELASA